MIILMKEKCLEIFKVIFHCPHTSKLIKKLMKNPRQFSLNEKNFFSFLFTLRGNMFCSESYENFTNFLRIFRKICLKLFFIQFFCNFAPKIPTLNPPYKPAENPKKIPRRQKKSFF